MRQKSLNENMISRDKSDIMINDIIDIDDLLDDEGWDLLNGLTEEELEQLNADFDPENSLLPVGDRGAYMNSNKDTAPMFSKDDLVNNLEKIVAESAPVIKNEKLRLKEEQKKIEKEKQLKKQYSRDNIDLPPPPKQVALTQEEEDLLNEATEEELIEAAENALQRQQYDIREKLLIALKYRKTKQQSLMTFIDNNDEPTRELKDFSMTVNKSEQYVIINNNKNIVGEYTDKNQNQVKSSIKNEITGKYDSDDLSECYTGEFASESIEFTSTNDDEKTKEKFDKNERNLSSIDQRNEKMKNIEKEPKSEKKFNKVKTKKRKKIPHQESLHRIRHYHEKIKRLEDLIAQSTESSYTGLSIDSGNLATSLTDDDDSEDTLCVISNESSPYENISDDGETSSPVKVNLNVSVHDGKNENVSYNLPNVCVKRNNDSLPNRLKENFRNDIEVEVDIEVTIEKKCQMSCDVADSLQRKDLDYKFNVTEDDNMIIKKMIQQIVRNTSSKDRRLAKTDKTDRCCKGKREITGKKISKKSKENNNLLKEENFNTNKGKKSNRNSQNYCFNNSTLDTRDGFSDSGIEQTPIPSHSVDKVRDSHTETILLGTINNERKLERRRSGFKVKRAASKYKLTREKSFEKLTKQNNKIKRQRSQKDEKSNRRKLSRETSINNTKSFYQKGKQSSEFRREQDDDVILKNNKTEQRKSSQRERLLSETDPSIGKPAKTNNSVTKAKTRKISFSEKRRNSLKHKISLDYSTNFDEVLSWTDVMDEKTNRSVKYNNVCNNEESSDSTDLKTDDNSHVISDKDQATINENHVVLNSSHVERKDKNNDGNNIKRKVNQKSNLLEKLSKINELSSKEKANRRRRMSREKSIDVIRKYNEKAKEMEDKKMKQEGRTSAKEKYLQDKIEETEEINLTKLLKSDKIKQNRNKNNRINELAHEDEDWLTESSESEETVEKDVSREKRTSRTRKMSREKSIENIQKHNDKQKKLRREKTDNDVKQQTDLTTTMQKSTTKNHEDNTVERSNTPIKTSTRIPTVSQNNTSNTSGLKENKTNITNTGNEKPSTTPKTTTPIVIASLDNTDSQTNHFLERRKARQRRLDDNYIEVKSPAYEEKLCMTQQIDLFNLQKMKEKVKKETEIEVETNLNIKKEPEPKVNNFIKPPTKEITKKELERPIKKTQLSKQPTPNTKEEGLKQLESIRSKLRKVPKPEPEPIEMDQEEMIRNRMKVNVNDSNIEVMPAKPSVLTMLLQQDAAKLENKRFETKKEDKIDCRGVTADLLKQALLKMNGVLTNEQINSVWAGEKPKGASIKTTTSVKSTDVRATKRITKEDVETELDIVELMRCLKNDTDDLFYICINNQPKLEKKCLQEIFRAIEQSKKVKHVSLAMTGIIDADCKVLAKALRYNNQIETLNLESNIITMQGIKELMKEVGRHPSLREAKVSNQKQPFGGQGEECMATAIHGNENILKFGYSFKQPGPRNKADRAIIRHNENLRQRRRNGEDVYDLKAVCKIRDPWPQPWIKVKGRRLLAGLLEAKVVEMGHMIDVDNDTRRESRGPKLAQKEALPLDINALLAQRKAKLRGTKIAELEQEQERKRKKQFEEMEESNKKEDFSQLNGNGAEKSTDLGDSEETPPVDKKKDLRGKGKDIVMLDDEEEENRPRRRNRRNDDEEEDINEVEEAKKKNLRGIGKKIISLEDEETKPVRRKQKGYHDVEEDGFDLSSFDVPSENKQEAEVEEEVEEIPDENNNTPKRKSQKEIDEERKKKLTREGGRKIVADLPDEENIVPRRRKQRLYEDEEKEATVNTREKKSSITDQAKEIEALPAEEGVVQRRKKLDPFSNVSKNVAKLPSPHVIRRRKERDDDEEEEIDPFKALEERKKREALEKAEAKEKERQMREEEKKRKQEEERQRLADVKARKKKLPAEGGKKVVELQPLEDTIPKRRRNPKFEEEYEENELKFVSETKKEEENPIKGEHEKEEKEVAPVKLTPKIDEREERKKQLSRGGKKIASLDPLPDAIPRRRKTRADDEKVEETKENKEEENEERRKRMTHARTEDKVEEKEKVEEKPKISAKDEAKKKLFSNSKKVAALPPPEEKIGFRRKKKIVDDDDDNVDPIALVENSERNIIANRRKPGKALPPPETGISSLRRRKKEKVEDKADPFASICTTPEKKKDQPEKAPGKKTIETKPAEAKKEPEKLSKSVIAQKAKNIASRRRKRDDDDEEEETTTIKTDIKKQTGKIETPKEEEQKKPEAKNQEQKVEKKENVAKEEKEGGEDIPVRRSRNTRQREDSDDDEKPVSTNRNGARETEGTGKWYTDEETKSGDRRFNTTKEAEVIDIFADRDEDQPKKLSLKERMARRGR